ncbi:anchored repeat-type ABC transporter permease subunit [Brevibacterium album]|uniref:anchored repeat-type ABC transporter permease subunit n=1 Tax=Brevibacterium album TaxID=417948 RepID=UPI0003FB5B67
MTFVEFLGDLTNPLLTFLPKALFMAVMAAVICGLVGTYVVLRGMAFIGDAVSHAVFPGLAFAFVFQANLVLGGAAAGITTALLVAIFSQNRRLKEDSIIGVFFVAAFALGIVVISFAPGYAGSLSDFLFGSITGIPDSDMYVVGITGAALVVILFLFHKELVAVSLDRDMSKAIGLPVFWLDILLYMLVTIAVVVSVQTIGNILVLALLITPAATARFLTDRLIVMMLLSPVIGAVGAFVGLYVSWALDLPVGGTIVLVLTAFFLVCWVLGPKHGMLARRLMRRGSRAAGAQAAVSEAAEQEWPHSVPAASDDTRDLVDAVFAHVDGADGEAADGGEGDRSDGGEGGRSELPRSEGGSGGPAAPESAGAGAARSAPFVRPAAPSGPAEEEST